MKITSTDYSLTDSIKKKIADFEDKLKRYFKETDDIEIILSKEAPNQFRVDFQTYAFGRSIRSRCRSHDFQKAFKQGSEGFIDSIVKAKGIFQEKKVSAS